MLKKKSDIASKIEQIKDKKIYSTDLDIDVEFSSMWNNMDGDYLVFVMFFRHWG